MKNKFIILKKLIAFSIGLIFLSLLCITTLHLHADANDHDDCGICHVKSILSTAYAQEIPAIVLILIIIKAFVFIKILNSPILILNISNKSPPLFF